MFDCVFGNGTVIDGTGKGGFSADVGVAGDKIMEVGDLKKAEAKKRIDCTGFVVTPGFIDPHSHPDMIIFHYPQMDNFIHQGITTIISGNCGYSTLPSSESYKQCVGTFGSFPWLDGIQQEWTTLEQYYRALEQAGIGLNIGQLVGHGPLRTQVMGLMSNRAAQKKDIQKMSEILESQLDEGVLGMSFGMSYVPSRFADEEEVVKLTKILKAREAIHAQHVRGLSSPEGIEEFLSVAKRTGCRAQMAHLTVYTQEDLEKFQKLFSDAAASGSEVSYTVIPYPYFALRSDTLDRHLGCVLGMHPKAGREEAYISPKEGYQRFRSVINNPEIVKEFKKILMTNADYSVIDYFAAWASPATMVRNAGFGEPPGQTVGEIAQAQGKDVVDTTWDLIFGNGPLYKLAVALAPENLIPKLLAHPQGVPMTDANYRISNPDDRGANPWPVAHGSFPRYFRIMRENGIPLETAVHKVTGLSAETFNIKDRGYLRKGQAADIAVFNAKEFRENATLEEPFLLPEGMRYVMVNGKFALLDYDITGLRAGKGIRRG